MNAKKIPVRLSDDVREFLIKKGYDERYGARPLRRAMERYVEDFLTEEFFKGVLSEGAMVQLNLSENEQAFLEKR
jgi:ATP-dependent Clp protease ATP-binding subunit ClpA